MRLPDEEQRAALIQEIKDLINVSGRRAPMAAELIVEVLGLRQIDHIVQYDLRGENMIIVRRLIRGREVLIRDDERGIGTPEEVDDV